MAQEREPKGITRRQFLRIIGALGVSALFPSCGVEEKPSSPKPTETPSPTATTPPTKVPPQESSLTPSRPTLTPEPTLISKPTLTPEPTSTPEVVFIPGIILTEEYLKNAFAGVGGEEVITNGQKEVSLVQFGQEYVSQSWGQEINFANLPQSPINSLKYLVSLGAYQGQEGVYSPGKQGEEVIFPQLAALSLARLALKSVPSEMEQKEQDYREQISPLNLTLCSQTQMTIVGLFNEPRPGAEVTVDKEAPGGEPNYALVAFTDYLRASEKGTPRHYLAILPTHFPADPENKNALSLQNLLEANGYQYDSQSKEIVVVGKDNQKTVLGLNRVEGEELTKNLRQAVGLAFVDQIKDELIANPIVPYPDQMSEVESPSPESTVTQEPTPVKEEVFNIKIREGESLSSILSFYGIDEQNIENHNSGEVTIKMPLETYEFPYKKLCLPTVGMSITSWKEEWNLGELGYGDLVAYTTLFPYSFFGHTSEGNSDIGTFAGLRSIRAGDRFYLSRTWTGEDGDWIEAKVIDIVKVYRTEEEIAVTNRSNSQLLSFTTCFVESNNPDSRIIVLAKVINYNAKRPTL